MILILGGACQGKRDYVASHFPNAKQVTGYHERVKAQLQACEDPMEAARRLVLEENDDGLVIVTDEIGYGIVPLNAFEREYREANGRVNCYLASQADQVIRVIAGLGQRLK